MKTIRQPLMLASALAAALALSACGKGNEPSESIPPAPPPSATATAPPMTPPMSPPPPSTTAMASGETGAVTFSSVEIGSNVDANNKIRAAGTSFAPTDNIYASVETTGSGHATLAAKWTYNGDQTVHEDSKVLDTMGAQTTAFMISKPDGFPAGNYKVEISLDGQPVASKDFSVKK